eukprot:1156393-Pelagomonas_calceolata.AAC.4
MLYAWWNACVHGGMLCTWYEGIREGKHVWQNQNFEFLGCVVKCSKHDGKSLLAVKRGCARKVCKNGNRILRLGRGLHDEGAQREMETYSAAKEVLHWQRRGVCSQDSVHKLHLGVGSS